MNATSKARFDAITVGDVLPERAFTASNVSLFLYNAAIWNAHRIHYDADYARDEEGYNHTVQNGGLTMQTVTDIACRHTDRTITGLNARLTKPIWVGDTVTVHGRDEDGGILCWIADQHGHLCAEMNIGFE